MTCCDHGYGRPSWRPRVFLRQAQDRRPLRRTVQVRLGTNTLRLPGTRRKRLRCAWHAHLLRARSAPLSPASGFPVSWSRDSNA
ncbi:MAG: hypothetical protein OEV22_12790 [Deltaproteobacteria bacterium]|nr:hypothetical protein [Deltaproteobacteria bacterium]